MARETICDIRTTAYDSRHKDDIDQKRTLRNRKRIESMQLPEVSFIAFFETAGIADSHIRSSALFQNGYDITCRKTKARDTNKSIVG